MSEDKDNTSGEGTQPPMSIEEKRVMLIGMLKGHLKETEATRQAIVEAIEKLEGMAPE